MHSIGRAFNAERWEVGKDEGKATKTKRRRGDGRPNQPLKNGNRKAEVDYYTSKLSLQFFERNGSRCALGAYGLT